MAEAKSKSSKSDHTKHDLTRLRQPPLKRGWPLLGSFSFFTGDKAKFFRECEGFTRIKVAGQNIVIVHEAEWDEVIWKREGTHFEGGKGVPNIPRLVGYESILYLSREPHKRLRSALLPCFRPSDLLATVPQIQKIASRHFEQWAEMGTLVLNRKISDCARDLAMNFLGLDVDSIPKEDVDSMPQHIDLLMSALFTLPFKMFGTTRYAKGVKAAKKLREIAAAVVAERRKANSGETAKKQNQMMETDLLQRLLDARDAHGKPLSEQELSDTLLTFIAASVDTTTAAMSSFFVNMCRFPEAQKKGHDMIKEALEVTGEYGSDTTIATETWSELHCSEQILMECQRYDPPVAITTTRLCTKDCEVGGFLIKKGTSVLFDIIRRSRSPKLWENPNEFDVNRFDKSHPDYKRRAAKNRVFGGGRKQCIGKGFAWLELKVFITRFLRDYQVEYADPECNSGVHYPTVLNLDGPLKVKLTRRQKDGEKIENE